MFQPMLIEVEKRIDEKILPEIKSVLMQYWGELVTPKTKEEMMNKILYIITELYIVK